MTQTYVKPIPRSEQIPYEEVARTLIAQLANHFGIPVPTITIVWDLKGRSRAGVAMGRTIRLNPHYAAAQPGRYLETVIHELCHVVTTVRRGGAPRQGRWSSHGSEWARAMRVMGLRPERCMTDTEAIAQVQPARITRKIRTSCGCAEGHEITPQRRALMLKGRRYLCRACRQEIKL